MKKTITARASENEYNRIKENAERNGMKISQYLVQSAVNDQELTMVLSRRIGKELIRLEDYMVKKCDQAFYDEEIQERITEIWRILNA